MHKLSKWEYLKYTGLWIPPCLTIAASAAMYWGMGIEVGLGEVVCIMVCSTVAPLYIWSINLPARKNGVLRFPIFPSKSFVDTDPRWQLSFRERALHKPVSPALISSSPEGVIFGKDSKGHYVRNELCKTGASHTLVLGTSGSGKTSSVLLSTLLANKESDVSIVCIDVKGELLEKGLGKHNPNVVVFNPRSREGFGFDFLSEINELSGEGEVLECLKRLCFSFFPQKQSTTDSFWVDAPRNVCLGLMLYGWKKMGLRTIPDLVDFVFSKNLKELINEVLVEEEEGSVVYKLLVSFGGDSPEETMGSIAMNLVNGLSLIATDNTLRFLLREKQEKITPDMVDKGKHIDLVIEDQYLEQYAPILNLAISSCFGHVLKRTENPNNQKVLFVIDELGRLCSTGQLGYGSSSLQSFLQIGRSKNGAALLALQSWSALKGVYSEGQLSDMLNNLGYRLVLSGYPDDQMMVDMVVKSFGTYRERKKSISTGKSNGYSYNFEEKNIIEAADLLSLPDRNRVILLSPYGAFYLNKCQYFKDSKLKKLSKQLSNS